MREAVTLKTLLTKDNRFSLQFIGKNSVSSPQQPHHPHLAAVGPPSLLSTQPIPRYVLCPSPTFALCHNHTHVFWMLWLRLLCVSTAPPLASLTFGRPTTLQRTPSSLASQQALAQAANATRVASFALKTQDTGTRFHYFRQET